MPEQLDAFLNHTEQVVRQLLAVYRQENIKHRKTEVPTYFRTEFCFPVETLHQAEAPRGTLDTKAIERVNAAYSATINSITDDYEKAVLGFQKIVAQHRDAPYETP